MAIALVLAWPGANTPGSGNSCTTSDIDTTGANFIAVAIATGSTVTTVADNKGNTYTLAIGPMAASTDNVYIYRAENATGGAGHHITVTTAGSFEHIAVAAAAYSGMLTASVLDKTTSAGGNSTSLNSGNTAATAAADELLIGAGTLSDGTNTTFSAGAGYTMRSQFGNASVSTIVFLEDQIVSATGVQAATATWGGSAGPWVCGIATFKGTAGGGGATIYNRKIFDSPIFKSRLVA